MATTIPSNLAAEAENIPRSPDGVKVLHVLGDSNYGGAAKSTVRLARLWKSGGWHARILTSDPVFQQAATSAEIGYCDLDCIWRKIRPFKDLAGLFRLYRFLRSERVTIVHTHTTKAGFIGRIAAHLAGVPIIIHTIHGFAFHERSFWGKIAFYTRLERIAARCCHRIITVSRFHRDWALRLRIAEEDKLQAIPNGIPDIQASGGPSRQEIRASLGVSDDEILLFTPGRIAAEKGLEDLLVAVAATDGRLSQRLHVALAGEGPLLPSLKRTADTLGLTDQVQFLGFREDIGALLAAADIVALPSLREGLSIALLEAMSAGRAIIATSIGSNLEAVGFFEETSPVALLTRVKDRKGLADAIVRLSADERLREELGKRARLRWEQRYTIERAEHSYKETYQELLRDKRPRMRTFAQGA